MASQFLNVYKKSAACFLGAGIMPIRPLLQDGSFSPEDITALTTTFEDSLSALGLLDRNDPAVLIVAKRIIELAKDGERNPARLQNSVVNRFQARSR